MRTLALVTILALTRGIATAGEWPPATTYLSNGGDCSAAQDRESCEYSVWAWSDQYAKAIGGRRKSMRSLSYSLSTGALDGWVKVDAVLACAWRIVIVQSNRGEVDQSDVGDQNVFCGSNFLNDEGRRAAEERALTMLKNLGHD